MTQKTKLAIMGAGGRMGRMITQVAMADDTVQIVAGTTMAGDPIVGTDMGLLVAENPTPLNIMVTDNAESAIEQADVIIDFTAPNATLNHLSLCEKYTTHAIIGTTGFTSEQEQQITAYAQKTAHVFAPNYSVGVTILRSLCEQMGALLPAEDFDVEISEMHHKFKVDAPSGTALGLGKSVAQGRGVDHDTVKQAVRDGITGERPTGEIGYATLRGGSVIGDHTVMFASQGERLELTHRATDRTLFANGAVRAGKWVVAQSAGLYDMKHVIGIQ